MERDRNADGKPENARPRDRYGAPLPRDADDELADRQEPDAVCTGIPDAFARAVGLFDARRFFEAHEFLEYIWKSEDTAPADRDFWKGVTQVAVGCTHVQRGNAAGAVTLLERAVRYLAPYSSPHHGVDRDALAAAAQRVAAAVRAHGPSPDLDFPRFPTAPAGADARSAAGLAPGERYRCTACGNLTRFDVESIEQVRRFWHADLAGVGHVEQTEHLSVEFVAVVCRWCGARDGIETVAAPGHERG